MTAVFIDLVWTALGVSHGSGPLTRAVLRVGWQAATPLRHRQSHGWLAAAGLLTVLATLGLWVVLLWAAWSLIFLSSSGGIVDRAGVAAGGWDRVYFAGYSLFTLGNGEFQPAGAIWQTATVLTALSGLSVVSLAIAYLVLVASAAAERHTVAVQISLLGERPEEVVLGWWAARRSAQNESRIAALEAPIVELTQRHLAYPVLHFFHSAQRRASPSLAIAVLDDAITVLTFGVAQSVRPPGPMLNGVRRAIDDYLDLVGHGYRGPCVRPPPLSLHELAASGIPVVDQDEFGRVLEDLAPRRLALHQLVAAEGFSASGSPSAPCS